MNGRRPAIYLFLSIFLLVGHQVSAQRHYVYLQSDDRRPFFVRIGQEVHSSTATGYLIIPRLADSNYVFRVGYPQGDRASSVFAVTIAHRDHGYQLVCNGQECVMVDMQDGARVKGVVEEIRKEPAKTDASPGTGDVFTNGLALAIGDPQLTRTELVKQEPKLLPPPVEPIVKANTATQVNKKDPAKLKESAPPKQDRAVTGKEETTVKVTVAEKAAPVVVAAPVVDKPLELKKAPVEVPKKDTQQVVLSEVPKPVPAAIAKKEAPKLVSQRRDDTGASYLYTVGPALTDTVEVWIAGTNDPAPVVPVLTEKAKSDIAADLGAAKEVKKEPVKSELPTTSEKVRTDCKARANAKDVDALKKKLSAIRDEDEKVAAALAGFKARCFDTDQLKELCGLFARNEGKYKLMDAVYPHIYDPSRFPGLEGLLTDPYFVHRLKVLTGTLQMP